MLVAVVGHFYAFQIVGIVVGILTNLNSLFVLISSKHYYIIFCHSFDFDIIFFLPNPKHLELLENIENVTNAI